MITMKQPDPVLYFSDSVLPRNNFFSYLGVYHRFGLMEDGLKKATNTYFKLQSWNKMKVLELHRCRETI